MEKMKATGNPSLNVRLVKNSRPIGKVFRKRNSIKQDVNKAKLPLENECKINRKSGIDEVHKEVGNLSNKSNNTVFKGQNLKNSSLSENDNEKDVRHKNTQKRKADEPLHIGEVSAKFAKRTVFEEDAPAVSNKSKLSRGSKTYFKQKKRNMRRKKKKENQKNGTLNQYKPVLIVKDPKNISGNWKNLKDIIIQQDKAKAEKIKEDDNKHERLKHCEGKKKTPKPNKKMKNREKLILDQMIEEQKRQAEAYQNLKKKHSVKDGETNKKKMEDIWFDNVDPILLGEEYNEGEKVSSEVPNGQNVETVEKDDDEGDGKAVAIDCEMVGIGIDGKDSMLARVSIVNQYCRILYDKYVKPQEPVIDYRTEFSGIRPEDIEDGHDFKEVQSEVAKILNGKILVGHGLDNDLRVLYLQHPRSRIRDTARYKPFKRMCRGHTPRLKTLAQKFLGVNIQTGEHDSVQDAQAVMRIYTLHRKEWDSLKKKVFQKPNTKTVKTTVN